ncbi:MAG: hypothetical protein ABIF88_01095 [archaeon]
MKKFIFAFVALLGLVFLLSFNITNSVQASIDSDGTPLGEWSEWFYGDPVVIGTCWKKRSGPHTDDVGTYSIYYCSVLEETNCDLPQLGTGGTFACGDSSISLIIRNSGWCKLTHYYPDPLQAETLSDVVLLPNGTTIPSEVWELMNPAEREDAASVSHP